MKRKELFSRLRETDIGERGFLLRGSGDSDEFDPLFEVAEFVGRFRKSELPSETREMVEKGRIAMGDELAELVSSHDFGALRRMADALEGKARNRSNSTKLTHDLHEACLQMEQAKRPLVMREVLEVLKVLGWRWEDDVNEVKKFKIKVRREWERCGLPELDTTPGRPRNGNKNG